MSNQDLEDVEANIRILIREELETRHWLDGHPTPVPDCPVCQSHVAPKG